MKTNLAHVRVNVSDIQKSLKWYEEVLGFIVDGSWPIESPKYYDFVSEGGATFAIMEVESAKSYGRLNFNVEDVDALWQKLKDKVDILEPLFDTPWGTENLR